MMDVEWRRRKGRPKRRWVDSVGRRDWWGGVSTRAWLDATCLIHLSHIYMGKMRWRKKSSQSPHLKKLAWGLHRHGKDAVEKEVKPVATP